MNNYSGRIHLTHKHTLCSSHIGRLHRGYCSFVFLSFFRAQSPYLFLIGRYCLPISSSSSCTGCWRISAIVILRSRRTFKDCKHESSRGFSRCKLSCFKQSFAFTIRFSPRLESKHLKRMRELIAAWSSIPK